MMQGDSRMEMNDAFSKHAMKEVHGYFGPARGSIHLRDIMNKTTGGFAEI